MRSSYAKRTLVRQVNTTTIGAVNAHDVFVVDACRTPIGRHRGGLSGVRPDDLSAQVLGALLARNSDVPPDEVADVVWGAANQAGEDNRNVARMAVLLAGLPLSVPGRDRQSLVRLGPRRRQPGCRRPRPRSR